MADYVLDPFQDLSPNQIVLALCSTLQHEAGQVLIARDDSRGRAVLDEASLLHELEEVSNNLALLIELFHNLLHLSVLSALVVLFVLLLCISRGCALGLSHVGLVLVLLLLVLSNLGLDLLDRDAPTLLDLDAVIRNHVDKAHAGEDHLLFLLKD